jgi:hypothetical protein
MAADAFHETAIKACSIPAKEKEVQVWGFIFPSISLISMGEY